MKIFKQPRKTPLIYLGDICLSLLYNHENQLGLGKICQYVWKPENNVDDRIPWESIETDF